jgi:hypothetical protein
MSDAGRAALVMPAMFAVGDVVIGNPTIATFAAFGSFARRQSIAWRMNPRMPMAENRTSETSSAPTQSGGRMWGTPGKSAPRMPSLTYVSGLNAVTT